MPSTQAKPNGCTYEYIVCVSLVFSVQMREPVRVATGWLPATPTSFQEGRLPLVCYRGCYLSCTTSEAGPYLFIKTWRVPL